MTHLELAIAKAASNRDSIARVYYVRPTDKLKDALIDFEVVLRGLLLVQHGDARGCEIRDGAIVPVDPAQATCPACQKAC